MYKQYSRRCLGYGSSSRLLYYGWVIRQDNSHLPIIVTTTQQIGPKGVSVKLSTSIVTEYVVTSLRI